MYKQWIPGPLSLNFHGLGTRLPWHVLCNVFFGCFADCSGLDNCTEASDTEVLCMIEAAQANAEQMNKTCYGVDFTSLGKKRVSRM